MSDDSENDATKNVGAGYVAVDSDKEKTTMEARDHRAAYNRQRILRNDRGGL